MVIGLGAALLAAVLFGVGSVVQAIAARRRLPALAVVLPAIVPLGQGPATTEGDDDKPAGGRTEVALYEVGSSSKPASA